VAEQYGAAIEIDYHRLARTREGLRTFAPKTLAAVDRDIREAGREVTADAAATVNARARSHRKRDTARGYRVQVRAAGVRLVNATQGGAILEFAAQPRCPQGASLVATLNERYGSPGRVLWGAWDRRAEAVNARIAGTIEGAERALQAAIDGA
jgi:hypothetical protein